MIRNCADRSGGGGKGSSNKRAFFLAIRQHGELPAAGGAATLGAALVVDDAAGETDQDRGEGCAAFPEGRLSDGRSGGSARVVPGHPQGNREPENTFGGIGIREKMK